MTIYRQPRATQLVSHVARELAAVHAEYTAPAAPNANANALVNTTPHEQVRRTVSLAEKLLGFAASTPWIAASAAVLALTHFTPGFAMPREALAQILVQGRDVRPSIPAAPHLPREVEALSAKLEDKLRSAAAFAKRGDLAGMEGEISTAIQYQRTRSSHGAEPPPSMGSERVSALRTDCLTRALESLRRLLRSGADGITLGNATLKLTTWISTRDAARDFEVPRSALDLLDTATAAINSKQRWAGAPAAMARIAEAGDLETMRWAENFWWEHDPNLRRSPNYDAKRVRVMSAAFTTVYRGLFARLYDELERRVEVSSVEDALYVVAAGTKAIQEIAGQLSDELTYDGKSIVRDFEREARLVARAKEILESAGAPAEAVLPDLAVLPSKTIAIRLSGSGKSTRKLLEYDHPIANLGPGVLHILPAKSGASYLAYQILHGRADEAGKTPIVGMQEVGRFSFAGHEDHNHYHFGDFIRDALYGADLKPVDSAIAGDKYAAGFCVWDEQLARRWSRSAAVKGKESPDRAFQNCERRIRDQGLSIGWADTYYAGTEGQYIDITGVPDGIYYLEQRITDVFQEADADRSNNTWVAKIQITGKQVQLLGTLDGNAFAELRRRTGPEQSPQ